MTTKVTLMEAYVIEALKAAKIPDEVIIEKVQARQVEDFQTMVASSFDFGILYGITQDLPSILAEGYKVKFLTFPGLKRLLSIKLQKEEEKDYLVEGFRIEQLQLLEEEQFVVDTFLSANWKVEKDGDTYTISPNQL